MKSILVISRHAAPPYPAAPDFLHGKACHTILRSLCSLTNRVPLPPHPGDRINRSMLSCRDMASWLSIHSPTAPRGEGGAVKHQRGEAPCPSGADYKKVGPPPPVISTEAERSGEISPSDGTGSITVGDLSTQSIMGAFSICLP